MILYMYAIRDMKSTWLVPSVEQNDQVAIRNFRHACMSAESVLHTHPDDFVLYRIGSYDNLIGAVSPEEPVRLVSALEVLA